MKQFGFIDRSLSFLPIDTCLLFSKTLLLTSLQPYLPNKAGTLKIFKVDASYFLLFFFEQPLLPEEEEPLCTYLETAFFGALVCTKEKNRTVGRQDLSICCLGLRFSYSPLSFLQNHPEQSEKIYQHLVEVTSPHKKVLDLYCGIGISSLLIAKEGKQVLGVEINPEAISIAQKNANQLEIKASFLSVSVEKGIRKILLSFAPDCILVNPPRTGLSPTVLEALKESSCQSLIYVSCDPATLARDLATLKTAFDLIRVTCFDMFPQTTHVETLVELKKKTP